MKKKISALLMILCLSFCLFPSSHVKAADSEKTTITFADVGWDSIKLNNAMAGLVAEQAFGCQWEEIPSSTSITHEALKNNEIDVCMEEWTDNIATYRKDKKNHKFTELGVNYADNHQGLYVPRYVVDEHPGLKTVQDLKNYTDVFKDPDEPGKIRIYGGVPGWGINDIMEKKIQSYGLSDDYEYVPTGSNAALDSSLTSAFDKKEPFISYYWEPTWLMGKYDFVLLEDTPYDPATFKDGIGACTSIPVTIAVSNQFAESNPEFCEFLSRYHTSSDLISEGLFHMQETGDNHKETAEWILKKYPELLTQWLTEDQQNVMTAYLNSDPASRKSGKDLIFDFPFVLEPDTDAIDHAVRHFAASAGRVLDILQNGLGGLVRFFNWILTHIPWFLLLFLVFFLGWHLHQKWISGLLYAVLLSLVGVAGLWSEMLLTLSIVLASVSIALLLGLPIGILISNSVKANAIARPILDTMQTMPVFVYLIPALLLFGMGNASAVMATVVYAIVPVIRLTSLGIRQVDEEVVEAAKSFGSTKWQTLFKVQIPQALPTIMTGVNQTLMMAMAMVVTCSMIGARGLGMEVLNAVNRIEIGRGLVVGGCVVILAIILDRLTQGFVSGNNHKKEQKEDECDETASN